MVKENGITNVFLNSCNSPKSYKSLVGLSQFTKIKLRTLPNGRF